MILFFTDIFLSAGHFSNRRVHTNRARRCAFLQPDIICTCSSGCIIGTKFACLCSCCFAVVVPYFYALGNELFSYAALANPELIDVTLLANLTKTFALSGLLDPTRNMFEDRVFIYNGANDILITPGRTFLFAFITCLMSFFLYGKQDFKRRIIRRK